VHAVTLLAPILQAWFTERLLKQRQVSPNTIAAYRDTFRLLLGFAQACLGKPAHTFLLADFDATVITAFLEHLETKRQCTARTRNARLAAIRSFFRFAATREPTLSGLIQRVLTIPQKRTDRRLVSYLTPEEVDALLATPDRTCWLGRRDHLMLLVALQTGLRVSELTGLRAGDCTLGSGANVRCVGKGRKERCTPVTPSTAAILKDFIAETARQPADFVFPSRAHARLSRDAVERLVLRHAAVAAKIRPSLATKRVTPHSLRHTTAINLLQSGVDRAVIALWLGHESVETTLVYLQADLAMKERALARTAPAHVGAQRFQPKDSLLAFLEAL